MTTFNPISMNKQQMHLPYQSSISNPMLITDKVSIKPTIHTPQTSNTMNTNPTILELMPRNFLYILSFSNKSKSIINHRNIEKYANIKTIECV